MLHGLRRYDEAVDVHRGLLDDVRSGVLNLSAVMTAEMLGSLLVRTANSLAELGRWPEVLATATEAVEHSVAATAPPFGPVMQNRTGHH